RRRDRRASGAALRRLRALPSAAGWPHPGALVRPGRAAGRRPAGAAGDRPPASPGCGQRRAFHRGAPAPRLSAGWARAMIEFWIAAALLVLVALAFLLLPVLRERRRQAEEVRTALNVAPYQERLAELERQYQAGMLG